MATAVPPVVAILATATPTDPYTAWKDFSKVVEDAFTVVNSGDPTGATTVDAVTNLEGVAASLGHPAPASVQGFLTFAAPFLPSLAGIVKGLLAKKSA